MKKEKFISLIKEAVSIEIKPLQDENIRLKAELDALKQATPTTPQTSKIDALFDAVVVADKTENTNEETLTGKDLHDYIFKKGN